MQPILVDVSCKHKLCIKTRVSYMDRVFSRKNVWGGGEYLQIA